MVAVLATNQAKVHGMAGKKGVIAAGADADLVVWDPDLTITATQANRHGNVDYTPYEGMTFHGAPAPVYVRGALAYRDGEVRRGARHRAGSCTARSPSPRPAAADPLMADADAARAVAGLAEIRAADRGRGRRAARRLDRHLDHRARLARATSSTEIDGVTVERDEAGNTWATAARRRRALRDRRRPPRLRAERRLARRRAQRRRRARGAARARAARSAPFTLKLVDWADEEGARFGRSLLGSSACAGTLDPDAVRGLTDRDGTALPDALAAHGVDLDRMGESGARARGRARLPRAAHRAGPGARAARPAARRRARHVRRRAPQGRASPARTRTPARARCTCAATPSSPPRAARSRSATTPRRATTCARRPASCAVTPGIVTAFNGTCEVSLDQRALDAGRARRHARDGAGRRRSGSPRRRAATVALGADLGDRADPVRRRA